MKVPRIILAAAVAALLAGGVVGCGQQGEDSGTTFVSLSSSSLAGIQYFPAGKSLYVHFRTGEVYQYKGVPAEVVEALKAAESKGAYFSKNIRGRYEFVRVERAETEYL